MDGLSFCNIRKQHSPIPVAGSFNALELAFTILKAEAAATADPKRRAEGRKNMAETLPSM